MLLMSQKDELNRLIPERQNNFLLSAGKRSEVKEGARVVAEVLQINNFILSEVVVRDANSKAVEGFLPHKDLQSRRQVGVAVHHFAFAPHHSRNCRNAAPRWL